jgi:AraC family transcriptional regulator
LAKVAIELKHALAERARHGTPGGTTPRVLARGAGWAAADVVCTAGPHDATFEEQHDSYAIAIVLAGTFQYTSALGRAVLTPGSVMLGNHGQCYQCGHEHGEGDRCVVLWYAPEYFERLAADAGARSTVNFPVPRLPPLRALSPIVTAAGEGATASSDVPWEELAVRLAGRVVTLAAGTPASDASPLNAEARVTRLVRAIERQPGAALTIESLAREARLSPYHFLRTFERLTGVTPHQFVLRTRLREAALRLAESPARVLDIALDCGFGDVSNFNRAFRTEFGVSPRAYRCASTRTSGASEPERTERGVRGPRE